MDIYLEAHDSKTGCYRELPTGLAIIHTCHHAWPLSVTQDLIA